MDDGNVAAGPARPEDLKLLDNWSATKVEAESAARKRGLTANQSAAYSDPASTAPSTEVAQ